MSRPKKEIKKNFRKEILFSEDEFNIITKMYSVGDYNNINCMLRDILLNNQYRIVTFNNDSRIQKNILIEQVRRIGNNFNQLIKHFNQKKLDHFTKEEILALQTVLNNIRIIYERIEKTTRQ